MTKLRLTDPQYEFVSAPEPYPCFCGGFGAGKTAAALARTLYLKLQYRKLDIAYYLPTYDLVRRVGFPRFGELFETLKIGNKPNLNDNLIKVHGCGQILFRSMEDPARIIGYEVADSLVDELDTLKPQVASDVWNRIISRNRQKKPDRAANTIGVATTPEGYRFVYERWKKSPPHGYRLIKAATSTNARNLPAGYIDSIRAAYPPNLLAAYLEGEFVNLTTGSVYASFERVLNASTETVRPNETVHVGMDFNVGKMAAAVHVLRGDDPHAVDELTDVFDTPAMAAKLTDRYKRAGHAVMVYPDASGNSRRSNNASESDLAILRQAGFTVCSNASNPAVKDRVLAMNRMIECDGKRRYRVNVERCPHLTEALERQAYDKNGEPDKSSGLDHILDATGYLVAYRWPVERPAMTINLGFAH